MLYKLNETERPRDVYQWCKYGHFLKPKLILACKNRSASILTFVYSSKEFLTKIRKYFKNFAGYAMICVNVDY